MAPLFGRLELFVQFWQKSSCKIILCNYFELGQVVQEEIEFKDISYLELWSPCCLAEWSHEYKFGKGHYEEQFCEIILNLDQWFRAR